MKHEFACAHARRNERGVALIIVLGFLGLMVMMAVAFMVQARVERMVADSTLEGMKARQLAQTAIAAATQDYMNYIKGLDSQSDAMNSLFLSGDLNGPGGYHYSGLYYGNTNLWYGEALDWLPINVVKDADINLNDIKDMEWIWVREKPKTRSAILGRYAYACFNLSGGVDANLLGRDYGTTPAKYGAATNRNNVRKMVLDAISTSPSDATTRQENLARYQAMWQGFDTPVALVKLTDGSVNTGDEKDPNRWQGVDIYEDKKSGGPGGLNTEHLSCYSYAALHRGSGYDEKKECTVENIVGNRYFTSLVNDMGGNAADVEKALEDYTTKFSDVLRLSRSLTDYPSVLPVPMFNEIKVELQLLPAEGSGTPQLLVKVKPEFWCPFPSRDAPDDFVLQAPHEIGGGTAAAGGSQDIWVRVLGSTDQGMFQPTLELAEPVSPAQLPVRASEASASPKSPGEFTYKLNIGGIPPNDDGSTPEIKALRVAGVIFQKPWELFSGSKAVDATPKDKLSIAVSPNTLTPGGPAGSGYMEVDDPRLNHLTGRWSLSSDGSMGEKNSCLDAARNQAKQAKGMGYEPGNYMYCRNGKMQSPAELGYIPVYGKIPWMTLDIFSEYGIPLMNTLVCDEDVWKIMDKYDVFYTNGTINPYTRDTAVLNGVFCGLDAREVPNMPGTISGNANTIGAARAKAISAEFVKDKTPDGDPFTNKDGPGGWLRVLRHKGFDFNKNQRVLLAHNTWGLFNESDSLFLVFVAAQSITEAPEKIDPVGDWNEKEDMITGERWAVALCWMDTSAEGAKDDLTQEMDIIMFKYLNE